MFTTGSYSCRIFVATVILWEWNIDFMQDKRKEKANFGFIFRGGGGVGWGNPIFFGDIYIYMQFMYPY